MERTKVRLLDGRCSDRFAAFTTLAAALAAAALAAALAAAALADALADAVSKCACSVRWLVLALNIAN